MLYYAKIAFTVDEGQFTIRSREYGVEQERYPLGTEMMVIYPHKHPEQARVLSENEGWIGPIMTAMFGIAFLVFGIVLTSLTGWLRVSRRTRVRQREQKV